MSPISLVGRPWLADNVPQYKLTKVVTLAPRFVVKSKLSEEILLRESGSSTVTQLKPSHLLPLRYLRRTATKQLSLCFPGVNNQW